MWSLSAVVFYLTANLMGGNTGVRGWGCREERHWFHHRERVISSSSDFPAIIPLDTCTLSEWVLQKFSAILGVSWCGEKDFPPGFKFGVATSAYQTEGGWNASDKGDSIWDHYVHTRSEKILDGSDGDIACDSYHRWRDDVQIATDLGVHFYRFSLSWTRILPTGLPDGISKDGVKFYNNLIDALIEKGIEPVVTLYHWDLPQRLQNLGGWTNPLVTDWFADYSRVVYTLFGDRVKTIITINEPIMMCDGGYNMGVIAPGVMDPRYGNYICIKNTFLAHAKAWRIYDEEFKQKYHGRVSITNHLAWLEPATEADEEIASFAMEYGVGLYTHPIFSMEGGWPPVIEKFMAEKSKEEGLFRSRLPPFTKEEMDLVKGTYDFFGFNHYTSRMVRKARANEKLGEWPMIDIPEINVKMESPKEWGGAATFWLLKYPEGIRKLLSWLKKRYGDMEFLMLENGYACPDDGFDDQDRILYYQQYLEQTLLAMKEDKVNVTGYTAWSLMDNFEWFDGYRTKFGLYHVDFNDPLRKRTARASAKYYADVIKRHSLDVSHNFIDEL